MSQTDGTIEHQALVTPNDDSDLPSGLTAGISVNVSGDVTITMRSGETVTRTVVPGIDYPWRVRRIHATNTDASGIHALYF